jgi:hypothetical protein
MITYGLSSQKKSENEHIWASSGIHQIYESIDLDAIGHEKVEMTFGVVREK